MHRMDVLKTKLNTTVPKMLFAVMINLATTKLGHWHELGRNALRNIEAFVLRLKLPEADDKQIMEMTEKKTQNLEKLHQLEAFFHPMLETQAQTRQMK